MLEVTDRGLSCAAGGFFVDPWRPVDRAIVTHAHGDHLVAGCAAYLVSADGAALARARLPDDHAGRVEALPYGVTREIGGVRVSLHPAGHILGSAQVRLEHRGEVWVASGDYKTEPDPTCAPWEPVRCHTFITESTFGLPVYRWRPAAELRDEINAWWRANTDAGRCSLLFGYALGKAQRLLAGLDPSIGPILLHGAAVRMTELYRAAGVALPPAEPALLPEEGGRRRRGADGPADAWRRAIVLAPPSAGGTTWARRFGEAATAFASGWMQVRGHRRRSGVDRGFALSDHVDWPQLLAAIDATGASRVLVTHGFTGPVVRWLRERGLEARALATRYEGDAAAGHEPGAPAAPA
ncbi:MAG: ligase-associated DNA damage response exonuclease [Gemmatimonadales bacterium]|nr:ligase-associated DNA damage response exonuclease [Gemmatimonadales bacterium]